MDNVVLLYKVITWRLISITLTLAVLYLATGDVKSATGITAMLHILLTGGHYVFERTWESLHNRAN